MKTTTKKPTVKKVTKKVESKTETTPKKEEKTSINKSLRAKMTNLETAYLAAISGKMKFSEVKEMFRKLHKEVKSSTKK